MQDDIQPIMRKIKMQELKQHDPPQPVFRHYKGDLYRLLTVGKMENPECNSQDWAVYQNIRTGEVWIRPMDEFNGNGDRGVKRFTLVGKEEIGCIKKPANFYNDFAKAVATPQKENWLLDTYEILKEKNEEMEKKLLAGVEKSLTDDWNKPLAMAEYDERSRQMAIHTGTAKSDDAYNMAGLPAPEVKQSYRRYAEEVEEFLIEYLNDLLNLDGTWMRRMVESRHECNPQIADHPTVQAKLIEGHKAALYEAGFLGVINGFIKTINPESNMIAANYSTDGSLAGFTKYTYATNQVRR